jgi:hypothetical protein
MRATMRRVPTKLLGAVAAAALAVPAAAFTTATGGQDPVRVSAGSPFARCSTAPAFTNAEVEPSLASDPHHADRLIAVYQQDRYHSGGARGIVAALSKDGGRRWRRLALPVSGCAGESARQAPFASDPWASAGPDGRIYVSTLSDVVSVMTSGDWGSSWSKPTVLHGSGLTDKPSVTADPRRAGTAYVVWSDYRETNPPGTESDELLSITDDAGRTWSTPRAILRHGKRAGPEDGQILVDPRSGRLYLLMALVRNGAATPADPAWLMIMSSTDRGGHWSRARRFGIGYPAPQRDRPLIRSSPQVPSFAIDRRGALYAVWQDSRFSHGARDEVLFTTSSDGGMRWTTPRKVSAPSSAGAIIPTVAASVNGHVGILYLQLDRGGGLHARYRLAISTDGGKHFRDETVSATFSVADAPALTPSLLVPGGYFLGDYLGIAPLGTTRFGALFITASGAGDSETDVFYTSRP